VRLPDVWAVRPALDRADLPDDLPEAAVERAVGGVRPDGRCEVRPDLRRAPDPALEQRAQEIADFLGLRLEIRDTGLGELERRLVELVEA
jgi:hypothetical protein